MSICSREERGSGRKVVVDSGMWRLIIIRIRDGRDEMSMLCWIGL